MAEPRLNGIVSFSDAIAEAVANSLQGRQVARTGIPTLHARLSRTPSVV